MKLHDVIPFVSLIAHRTTNNPWMTKIIENSIIGIIAAAFAIWANDIKQTEQINSLNVKFNEYIAQMTKTSEQEMIAIQKLEGQIFEMRKDLYEPRSKILEKRLDNAR